MQRHGAAQHVRTRVGSQQHRSRHHKQPLASAQNTHTTHQGQKSQAMADPVYASSLADVVEASHRVQADVHETLVLTSSTIEELCGGGLRLFFKCEVFQRT